MPDETLLNLREIAAQLDLPESTVRYYRDAFLDRIPSVGSGRHRRYPTQAVDVLRSIAHGYAEGRSRREIAAAIGQHDPRAASVAVPSGKAAPARGFDDVSNLDLLAAILDGEREQREALWQMAKEIVRLSEVLEGQDRVLTEIADHAGVRVGERPALSGGSTAALSSGPTGVPSVAPEPGVTPLSTTPASPSAVDRLRQELDAERALVERLREAKLQLERRAVDAEAELEERRRSSVLGRIFRGADSA